jgi:uncharacterized membrane protein
MNDDTMTPDPADVEKNKVMAIIAYLGCLCLIPLFTAKDSPYARYHVNQGFVLLLSWFVVGIASNFISFGMVHFVFLAIQMVLFVLMVLGIMNAANGKMAPLPLIGGVRIIT